MRSDFSWRLGELQAFGDRMASNQHVVADLSDDQLLDAITEPAALAGLRLQAGLAKRIVGDVHGESGALPLLQHALRQLWEHRDGRLLTHDAYTRIGGVEGALAKQADEVLARLETSGDGTAMRRLMLALTRLGDDAAATKQPARLDDLVSAAYPVGAVDGVQGGQAPRPGDVANGSDVSPSLPPSSVVFSPDGKLLATGSEYQAVARLWDTATRREVATLTGHAGEVRDVAFSPDGALVVTAGIIGMEFSPDDRLLATASFDGTARLWDPVTGDQVASLGGHASRVLDVAFSPDGTYLATSGHDDTVFIRHLVLTPEDACTLVADEVTASRLGEALGHRTPSACTDLR